MEYFCKRCGYTTRVKCNMYGHFGRRKKCDPIYNDIPVDELKKELDDASISGQQLTAAMKVPSEVVQTEVGPLKVYRCDVCNKVFSHKQSRWVHAKKCKVPQTAPNEVICTLKKENMVLRDKVQRLEDWGAPPPSKTPRVGCPACGRSSTGALRAPGRPCPSPPQRREKEEKGEKGADALARLRRGRRSSSLHFMRP